MLPVGECNTPGLCHEFLRRRQHGNSTTALASGSTTFTSAFPASCRAVSNGFHVDEIGVAAPPDEMLFAYGEGTDGCVFFELSGSRKSGRRVADVLISGPKEFRTPLMVSVERERKQAECFFFLGLIMDEWPL